VAHPERDLYDRTQVVMAKRAGNPRPRRRPKTTRRPSEDVALIFDRTEDNEGYHILRKRAEDAPPELGTIRPLREGRPIDGEVVSLSPRPELPLLCDVKVELPDPRRPTSDGPPQVATEEYRKGWDAIWGQPAGEAKPN
jgi:hypothetical protein